MPRRERLVPLAFQRWPIRWKLAAVSASLTFVILLIFGGIVGEVATTRIRSDFNRDLEEAATRLVSRTRIVERPFAEPTVYSPNLAAASLPAGATARVINSEGVVLDEAPKRGIELGPPSAGISSAGTLLVATEPVYGANNEVVGYIQYGRSDSHVDSTITRLWLFIVLGILGGTALAVLAGVALARRAMRPIATLTSTAKEIAATRDPSRQLPAPSADDEVAELSETLQEMLNALDASQTEREAAMQKQREFVADASHELRTPLTSILANLELLEAQLDRVDYGEERELAASAVRSSQRMSRLVSDLLILARSDAGQTRPKRDVDLGEIAMSAGREIAPSLGERSLRVDCAAAPLRGNQDELHRLVLNLLDNAVRYTPEGAEISLATSRDAKAGTVRLEVADSGPGIPEPMRERVFERFVRGQSSSDTAASDGTGLGLAMVRAIAASHGGTVTAGGDHELGGARLAVVLPALESAANHEESEGSQAWRKNGSPSELIDARIEELGDWRGETLARVRSLIKQADPDVLEEWKWRNPVWSHDGIVCTGEAYKAKVKLTFAKGASLDDPSGLFNSSLDGNTRRAIDIAEGEELDAGAFEDLVREAVALNSGG